MQPGTCHADNGQLDALYFWDCVPLWEQFNPFMGMSGKLGVNFVWNEAGGAGVWIWEVMRILSDYIRG